MEETGRGSSRGQGRFLLRSAILQSADALLLRAKRATEHNASLTLGSVPDDPAATMVAGWGEGVNGALKTVEGMAAAAHRHLERLVVLIAANFAGTHG